MERLTSIRQQASPDPEWLRYPFLYLSEYRRTPRPIVGEPYDNRENTGLSSMRHPLLLDS